MIRPSFKSLTAALATLLLSLPALARAQAPDVIQTNPGSMSIGFSAGLLIGPDYGTPVHGERRGIPHCGIEIRQDLIETDEGQEHWAARLVPVLREIAVDLA